MYDLNMLGDTVKGLMHSRIMQSLSMQSMSMCGWWPQQQLAASFRSCAVWAGAHAAWRFLAFQILPIEDDRIKGKGIDCGCNGLQSALAQPASAL